MWRNLCRWWRKSSGTALGVDIGSDSIKVAAVAQGKGGAVLTAWAMVDTPPAAVDESQIKDIPRTAAALRQAVAGANTEIRRAWAAVGGRQVFLRRLTYPRMPPDELTEAVKWDAAQYVPFDADSYYLDFYSLPSAADDNNCDVLVAAAPKTLIDPLVAVLTEAGLQPAGIAVEPVSLYRLVAPLASGFSRVMLVDIGASAVKIAIFAAGVPVITRSMPLGGRRFTAAVAAAYGLDAAEAELFKRRQAELLPAQDSEAAARSDQPLALLVAELSREVRRTSEYYTIQYRSGAVEHIYCTGGGILLANLAARLANQVETEVSVVTPWAGLSLPPRFNRDSLMAQAPQFSLALALAQEEGEGWR